MKISEISCWKSQKIQIEQYEPYDFAYGMKAEVDYDPLTEEGAEGIQRTKEELESYVDKWLAWEVKKWKNPKGAVKDIADNKSPF